ncbi:MAG: hypothetical protein ABI566_12800 [Pseudolysinimonas sp.]
MRFVLPVVVSALLLAGCASGPADQPQNTTPSIPGVDDVIAAPGEVQGQGTVIQVGDAPPQLCLGAIAESYPPQCGGPEITGWDWATAEGFETSGGVTWGAYVVTGGWDGITFSATSSMMLALYDPMPVVEPLLDPENAGDTDPTELERIQTELGDSAPFTVLESSIQNGYLWVRVIYDDGSIQRWANETYLPDAVVIRAALRDIG